MVKFYPHLAYRCGECGRVETSETRPRRTNEGEGPNGGEANGEGKGKGTAQEQQTEPSRAGPPCSTAMRCDGHACQWEGRPSSRWERLAARTHAASRPLRRSSSSSTAVLANSACTSARTLIHMQLHVTLFGHMHSPATQVVNQRPPPIASHRIASPPQPTPPVLPVSIDHPPSKPSPRRVSVWLSELTAGSQLPFARHTADRSSHSTIRATEADEQRGGCNVGGWSLLVGHVACARVQSLTVTGMVATSSAAVAVAVGHVGCVRERRPRGSVRASVELGACERPAAHHRRRIFRQPGERRVRSASGATTTDAGCVGRCQPAGRMAVAVGALQRRSVDRTDAPAVHTALGAAGKFSIQRPPQRVGDAIADVRRRFSRRGLLRR